MSKRSRERQLAKLAARRAADRQRHQRRRRIVGYAALGVVSVAAVVGFAAFIRGGEEPSPEPTAAPSPTATPEPGRRTGTVEPAPAPEQVACRAEAPKAAMKPKPQFAGPPPMKLKEGRTYIATLDTSCGDIVIELFAKQAPETVNSFVFLAEKRYFDGQIFHRIDTGIDVVQGGDPTGLGTGGPGYSLPDELSGDEEYGPGTVAMANAGPDTGGSQFFLIGGPDGHKLDEVPNFTVFGEITAGLEVVERILEVPIVNPEKAEAGDLSGQRPKLATYINRVTITVER